MRLSKAAKHHREHAGAKKGGSGFYGHHQEAKAQSKKTRRAQDKAATRTPDR